MAMGVGVEDLGQSLGIDIYPNPTENVLFIDLDKDLGQATIELFNELGELVIREEGHYTDKLEIDVQDLDKGIYLLRLKSNAFEFNSRSVKQ